MKSVLLYFVFCITCIVSEDISSTTIEFYDEIRPKKDDRKRILKTYQAECIEESKVNPDFIVKLKKGDWTNENEAVKNWALCVLVKLGLMTPAGVFVLDEAMSRLGPNKDKSKADKLIDDCLSKKAIPAQDIAWNYVKCHHKNDPSGKFAAISVLRI